MFVLPYKYYLDFYKRNTKPTPLRHLLPVFFVIVFAVFGAVSSLSFYLYSKEAPLRAKNDYIVTLANVYNASRDSAGDVLNNFKVAGTKTAVISTVAESSASANGYFIALDDQQKILDKIQLAQKNISFQRSQLTGKTIPFGLEPITTQIVSYLDNTQLTLTEIYNEQNFGKQLLQIQGPDFYLPKLTNDNLWQKPDKESVSAYYQDAKGQADSTLNKLAQVDPPQEFKNYWEMEIEYLNLVKLVSDNTLSIINTASVSQEGPTQAEKAYQFITDVKNQKNQLIIDLESERLKFISTQGNLDKFNSVINSQKGIEAYLESIKLKPESEFQNYINWASAKIAQFLP